MSSFIWSIIDTISPSLIERFYRTHLNVLNESLESFCIINCLHGDLNNKALVWWSVTLIAFLRHQLKSDCTILCDILTNKKYHISNLNLATLSNEMPFVVSSSKYLPPPKLYPWSPQVLLIGVNYIFSGVQCSYFKSHVIIYLKPGAINVTVILNDIIICTIYYNVKETNIYKFYCTSF
jgi:hypothetical protein